MLRLLGPVRHEGLGSFPSRGYVMLAVLTLAHGRRMARSELASRVWELSPVDQGLVNLRYVLKKIRAWERLNGVLVVDADPDSVGLSEGEVTDMDRILHASSPESADEFKSLASLWSGNLLDSMMLPGPELEHFVGSAREKLARRLAGLLLDRLDKLDDLTASSMLDLLESILPMDDAVVHARLSYFARTARSLDAAIYKKRLAKRVSIELGIDLSSLNSGEPSNADTYGAPDPKAARSIDRLAGLPRVLILPPSRTRASVAVPSQLARALMADLSMLLATQRTFAVIAPYTARRLDVSEPLEAAIDVNADYVVNCQVEVGDLAPRLWFALTRVDGGEILLADAVSLESDFLGRTQTQLAGAIATTVANRISEYERSRLGRPDERTSFVHYLLGVERLKYDLPSIRKAKKHLQQALRANPSFAPAIAMSARALNYEWLVLGRASTEPLREAMALAERANELDPIAANGHWEIGHSLMYLRRLDESLEHIRIARERAPHLADLTADEADVLVHLGRSREALDVIAEALSLNPKAPEEYLWVRGSAQFFEGMYTESVTTLSAMPDTMPVARLLAASHAMLGNLEDAALHRSRWLDRYPDFRLADWSNQIPIKTVEAREKMLEGLRLAGFQ